MKNQTRNSLWLSLKIRTLFPILFILLLLPSLCACFSSRRVAQAELPSTPIYDVVVVGGGPAGIGVALAAAKVGARTLLVERDYRIGGTTVQAEVCDIGLFYAWRRQIIAGPVWELVTQAVAKARDTLPTSLSRNTISGWRVV